MVSHRLLTTFAIVWGNLTLGFYVAIQGPTLIDLIEMLHINNDIMSYAVALSSLAYSFGGLLGGFLFNYIDRTLLIPIYYIIFAVANASIPFMTNFIVYTVINVFKMMCAGGTDAGANVWILEMWPGQDSWLQALHFTFAVGCALGPLLVEPFLSSDNSNNFDISGKQQFTNVTISNDPPNGESRIYIPFGVSGLASASAAVILLYMRHVDPARRQQTRDRKISQAAVAALASSAANITKAQQLSKPLLIPLMQVPSQQQQQQPASQCGHHSPASALHTPSHVHGSASGQHTPAATAAANTQLPYSNLASTQLSSADLLPASRKVSQSTMGGGGGGGAQVAPSSPSPSPLQVQADGGGATRSPPQLHQSLLMTTTPHPLGMAPHSLANSQQSLQLAAVHNSQQQAAAAAFKQQQQSLSLTQQQQQQPPIKITSKVRADAHGTPYYVMLAIALAAMCLSSYCGVEITSMNYLASFVVNLDMQLENRKSTAALMSSALTISFACGRGLGIWLAIHMRPHVLFYACLVTMAIGNLSMLVFANSHELMLWASICLFGVGCGPMFPAIVSFFDDKISKVTNTVSGIFILGSMFNVALNSLIIGHHVVDNALILIYCNLMGTLLLGLLFATLHMLTRVKKSQRVKKFQKRQQSIVVGLSALDGAQSSTPISIVTTAAVVQPPSAAPQQQQHLEPLPEHQPPPATHLETLAEQPPDASDEPPPTPPPLHHVTTSNPQQSHPPAVGAGAPPEATTQAAADQAAPSAAAAESGE